METTRAPTHTLKRKSIFKWKKCRGIETLCVSTIVLYSFFARLHVIKLLVVEHSAAYIINY